MKQFLKSILSCVLFVSNACQADTADNIQLKTIENTLSDLNINVLQLSDISNQELHLNAHLDSSDSLSQLLSSSLGSGETLQSTQSKAKARFKTYAVVTVVVNGYILHVADYSGTNLVRIVTALNGELEGLQQIAVNGVIIGPSLDIKWYKDHFEHKYADAKVSSYPDKQIFEEI